MINLKTYAEELNNPKGCGKKSCGWKNVRCRHFVNNAFHGRVSTTGAERILRLCKPCESKNQARKEESLKWAKFMRETLAFYGDADSIDWDKEFQQFIKEVEVNK